MTSNAAHSTIPAVVLAGERPGGNALARALGIDAGVLADVAGSSCLVRVLRCLDAAAAVRGGIVCGPAEGVLARHDALTAVFADAGFQWLAPASGPAASALAAASAIGTMPVLLTSGDHALLRPETVDQFLRDALEQRAHSNADLLIGLVPHREVQAAFPESKRTLLRFADGAFCGSNLFALLSDRARLALEFWRRVEALRKQPWKIAAELGTATLLRYLLRRLSVDQAMAQLSERAGCRVGWVAVHDPRAAVDVDSVADWELASRLLAADQVDAARSRASAGDADL
ncbi:MAG: NTP transferase domain-containing protein [Pseudomonadales bacterium]